MPSRARECEGQQTAHKQHPKIVEISAVERHSETAHPKFIINIALSILTIVRQTRVETAPHRSPHRHR